MIDTEILRQYCFEKRGVTEDMPFGQEVLALRVGAKIFALTNLGMEEFSVNLKAAPDEILQWREHYPKAVQPGYHMNKKHWNTVYPNRGIRSEVFFEMVDKSYEAVLKSLTKKLQGEISTSVK